jgi:8-oxo-dGTP diphosphatase
MYGHWNTESVPEGFIMTASKFFEEPQVAVGAIVVKDEKILLVKRIKAPHKDL